MKRRNGSTDSANALSKKKRLVLDDDVRARFGKILFDADVLENHRASYRGSIPYKHGVLRDLIEPALLRKVRGEIQQHLHFTPKETDIYKIHQSGDLANLDGLDDASLKRLPSLLALRDALYSPTFREYISTIAASGPLSGRKTDMAINVYTPGCHLLCHDDVIGSRRVSYILYLTDPDRPWKPEWGGALRLYPTQSMKDSDGDEVKVPSPDFSVSIPPAFNQMSFFAVQPGESFHDVEEVYHREPSSKEEDGGRVRMAISGWYHIPQEGEEGYEAGAEEKMVKKSSLAQLQGKADQFDRPQPKWKTYDQGIPSASRSGDEEDSELNEEDCEFLLQYMTPQYLTPDTVEELQEMFLEDSSLRLANFLNNKYSPELRKLLEDADLGRVDPLHSSASGTARPPHKHRFAYRQRLDDVEHESQSPAPSKLDDLVDKFLPSESFRKWLGLATGLTPTACNAMARRFRRGIDYTLATEYDDENPQLEVCLGITPSKGWGGGGNEDGEEDVEHGKGIASKESNGESSSDAEPRGPAESVGGYEVYMAGDDDDDDASDEGSDHGVPVPAHVKGSGSTGTQTGAGKRRKAADPAIYQAGGGGDDDEDDGVLFSQVAAWNTMSIVLRDRGSLKFLKYVSKAARGDRWDVCGEFRVRYEQAAGEDDAAAAAAVA